jgi:D-alanine-D-alanine ligase
LSAQLIHRIENIAKRIYRTLDLDGYARIDFRLSSEEVPYYIEANPNPELAQIEEFASSAKHDGIPYDKLLQRIVALGLSRARSAEVAA